MHYMEMERDPHAEATQRFGVDLNKSKEVLVKLRELSLARKYDDVNDLTALWETMQDKREAA